MQALRLLNHRKFDQMLRDLLEAVPTGGSLIELGCAPGSILIRIQRLRPDLALSGIDYAPGSLEATRAALERSGVVADLELADMRTYTPRVPFDAAVSAGLVEHFDDPGEIIEHHARLVRPGGCVIVSVPDFREKIVRRAFRWLSPDDFAVHNLAIMDPLALGDSLEAAGLSDVESGGAGGPLLYATPRIRPSGLGSVYLAFAKSWNLLVAVMPRFLRPWNAYTWASGRRRATRPYGKHMLAGVRSTDGVVAGEE